MNSIFVLCVGMMGAAPADFEARETQPVQVAQADYGILPGGCYRPAYRTPVAQRPVSYSGAADNCPSGWCGTTARSAACPAGICPPGNCVHGQCNANCPTGYCPTHGGYNTGSSRTWRDESQYHILPYPAPQYPSAGYSQPRGQRAPLPRTYDVNWTNTYRPVSTTTYGSQSSPFFN